MSRFIRLKERGSSAGTLVAVDAIAFVKEIGDGCVITFKYTGEELFVQEGLQAVNNRLKKDDTPSAE